MELKYPYLGRMTEGRKSSQFPNPYLIFLGDLTQRVNAKTGQGLVDWRPELCKGQYRLPGCTIDLGIPDLSVKEAKELGVKSMIIGIAPVGGNIKPEWVDIFEQVLETGINIVNGLHTKLDRIDELKEAATKGGANIFHIRTPPMNLPVGTGKKRSGKRVLMVGTDCGVGKKYSALALYQELQSRGIATSFRATGQTGIMIAGGGIPIDSVVVDFVSGAAEVLSPANSADHWDVIEGQGALHHPGYGAVSLGLLYGSQPDAIVLCHEATRKNVDGFPGFAIGPLVDRIAQALALARLTNESAECIGISVNTAWLEGEDPVAYLTNLSRQTGYLCVDPMRDGMGKLADQLVTL